MDALIVAPGPTEASMVARRLMRWGARTTVVADEQIAMLLLPERAWDAILVDHALGSAACQRLAHATMAIDRRILLITPAVRHELSALKAAGFTGYLVKPVRAVSLAARLGGEQDAFERVAGEADAGKAADAHLAAAPAGLAILVAEDNEINALLAESLLKRLGHRPAIAANGEAAVEAWLNADAVGAPYDLVLMDLHMPGSDGTTAARAIRTIEGERGSRRTPIVALTANAFDEDRETCLAAGMDGFLTKPLNQERLAAAMAVLTPRKPLAA